MRPSFVGCWRKTPSLAGAYTDEGWTALHLAANAEIAALLLDASADINA
jgi:hypothetical protein